jgi:hypothetical protein
MKRRDFMKVAGAAGVLSSVRTGAPPSGFPIAEPSYFLAQKWHF